MFGTAFLPVFTPLRISLRKMGAYSFLHRPIRADHSIGGLSCQERQGFGKMTSAMGTFIVAGLGNPGIAYEKTRHNAGYQALERLADKLSVRVTRSGFKSLYGMGIRNGGKVFLVKPETYMNNSGFCLSEFLSYYKVPAENLIVLCDDIDLPVGSLRSRGQGGPGTHNGLRSVSAQLGTDAYRRIRIGIGDLRKGDLADYVLGKPDAEQQEALEEAFLQAADAAIMILDGKLDQAQALYNRKHEGKRKEERPEPASHAETEPPRG